MVVVAMIAIPPALPIGSTCFANIPVA